MEDYYFGIIVKIYVIEIMNVTKFQMNIFVMSSPECRKFQKRFAGPVKTFDILAD